MNFVSTTQFSKKWPRIAGIALALTLACSTGAIGQQNSKLSSAIQKVMDRAEFKHANFGIQFYALDTGNVIYSHNPDKLFVPASTTKILTEGALLANLGKDYRFHTRIFHTGEIDKKGRLKGD